ncbi:MAG: hypothetical protein JO244_03240, partial [Solirubrobacterales bacterium]|nr:hypothetical protein [Solirubrobacterales bacterium]
MTHPDQTLVAAAARRISVPRAEVPAERYSFVLHAPLELIARATLLPSVAPDARDRARGRIEELVAGYEELAPLEDPGTVAFGSAKAAATALIDAVAARDLDSVDASAAWLDVNAEPAEVARRLAPAVLPALGAAGHANIALAFWSRARLAPGQPLMLRPLVRAL